MKKLVEGFKPLGGKHCVTTALRQIFNYNNCNITEEMLFGLGCGLSFVYLNLASSPMISGRNKVFEFEQLLAQNLNIDIKCKSSTSYDNALKKAKQQINNNQPVLIYVDMAYLKYLNLNENSHFGGHAVVLYGYDDDNEHWYISDRDNADYAIKTPKGPIASDYHLVSYNELDKARSSKHRPFPAKNKYLRIDFTEFKGVTERNIKAAIRSTCNNMLNAPAKLLGINGINKFSNEVLKWSKFSSDKLKLAGISNYFLISADGGTGGGMFRDMYGEFLIESSNIVNNSVIAELGFNYKQVAKQWNNIAVLLWSIHEEAEKSLLNDISFIAKQIAKEEQCILNNLKLQVQ